MAIDWASRSESSVSGWQQVFALREIAEELARANRLKRLELEHSSAGPLRSEVSKAWEG